MVLSQALAWIAEFLCIVETLRYVARISRVDTLNRAFHRIHIPAGILLLATAGLHSLLAGNFSDVSVSEIELAPALLTANWGTACFLCAIFLAVGYLPHRKLRRKWMFVHRVLAFLMLLLLVFHLADVGFICQIDGQPLPLPRTLGMTILSIQKERQRHPRQSWPQRHHPCPQ